MDGKAQPRAREVHMVGGLPFADVEEVFRSLASHLGPVLTRMPDGERMGWLAKVFESHAANPSLREDGVAHLNGRIPRGVPTFCLCNGAHADDLKLGPYGYADNAKRSYEVFKRLKAAGVVREDTRFQVTMAGPGTTVFPVKVPAETLLPRAADALSREIAEIVRAIPADELTIQLDVAMEAEHEEYIRAPESFDTPVHEQFHWTQDQMADAVAEVANRIPANVELGFHICTIWHHDPAGGQDNVVVVDTINALIDRIHRPIAYFHFPIIPEHQKIEDYDPLRDLRIPEGTKVFLGLITLADGLEGAKRRIALAEQVLDDFGVSFYCGLGGPQIMKTLSSAEPQPVAVTRRAPLKPRAKRPEPDDAIRRPTADETPAVLDLFREVAELPSEVRRPG
jgi:hypothetical protein